MKLSIFKNLLLISMFMVIAVSCGKDKKSSGGSNYSYYNPYLGNGGQSQTPTATGPQAIANLQAYIDGVETNQNIYGPIKVTKYRYSCSDLFGINFIQNCKQKYTSSDPYMVMIGATRGTNNPGLSALLTEPAGFGTQNVVQYGNLIYIVYFNGSKALQYVVDINRHSIVNPTIMKNDVTKEYEEVVSPTI